MSPWKAGEPGEPDWLSRLVRNRPGAIARVALLSWLVIAAIEGIERRAGLEWRIWAYLAFPAFAVTSTASVALFQRDPERAGPDALRGGLLAAVSLALIVGREAVQRFEGAGFGRVALASMASATIGAVVGALAGPVAGWGLRSAARAARASIRAGRRR